MSLPPEPPTPFEDQPTERHLFAKAPAGSTAAPTADPTPDDRTDDPDDLLEPDWDQPRRYSRLTVALAIGILVVLAFAAGAFVAGALAGPAGTACYPPSGSPPATTGA
ncbi:hypothetical protein [Pseudonocardia humida]|uniref:Uncharacterized protein n=1 Tax=Pseudonocardia humida TaxID=2800819 RepID=A0ABT1A6A8_9PSEU|nr:hypothetical protein [Pseudonocardia humida]MCO1658562.1 hypothetical protein [Pseudonocardia humida]